MIDIIDCEETCLNACRRETPDGRWSIDDSCMEKCIEQCSREASKHNA